MNESACIVFISYFSRLMALFSPEDQSGRYNRETKGDSPKNTVLKNAAEELTPSLECVKRLLQSRRARAQQEAPAGPSTSSARSPPSPALRGNDEEEEEEVRSHSPYW